MADFDKTDEWDIDRDLPRRNINRNTGRNADNYRNPQSGSRGYRQNGNGETMRRNGSRPYESDYNRTSSARSRRRKKKQQIKKIILTLVLTIILVGLIGVAVYILLQHLPKGGSSEETYTRELDITDIAVGNMAVWLSSLGDDSIDMSWVKGKCQNIKVTTKLTLGKDSQGNDSYSEAVDEASYEEMTRQVNETLSNIIAEIVASELVNNGYADSVQPAEAREISSQVLGMDIAQYVKENGVNAVPDIGELNASLTLGSGSYRISKGMITFNSTDSNPVSEKVIKKKDSLVLVDSGIVFRIDE